MKFRHQILLLLSGEQLQIYSWSAGKLSQITQLQNTETGQQQLTELLKKQAAPCQLLVDVIEEDFRRESIPHLRGASRTTLIQRKLKHYYPSTPFYQARCLHRQTHGRRDDYFLFSALTQTTSIEQWLTALQVNQTALISIQSVAHLAESLLKKMTEPHVLLVSWEKGSGLRQSYYHRKKLYFSRLIALHDNEIYSHAIAIETPRTQQYLNSLNFPPESEVLHAYVICHVTDRAKIESELETIHGVQYHFLDIQTLSTATKLQAKFDSSDATPIFLELLATQKSATNYANSSHLYFYRLWQIRWILFGLCALIILLSAVNASIFYLQRPQLISETAFFQTEAAQITNEQARINQALPSAHISASKMKSSIAIVQQLKNHAAAPEKFLVPLSQVMASFPKLNLEKIAWQNGAPATLIFIEGTLINRHADDRKTLEYLSSFQSQLQQTGYQVLTQKLPIDVSAQGELIRPLGQTDLNQTSFSFQLGWSAPP